MVDTDAEDGPGGWRPPVRAAYTACMGTEPVPDADRPTPVDGVVIADGTVPVLDGIAALGVEPRMVEDIAAFQLPAAGFDPHMSRIEPEPLRDRRPAELFYIEPYVPTAVRLGGFVIFPEAEISGLATSNIFETPVRQGDAALDRALQPARRHRLVPAMPWNSAPPAGAPFRRTPERGRRAYALEARGRLDIIPPTNIEALVSHQGDKDLRSAPNVPIAAAERAAVAFNHRFNRLSF